MLQLKIYRCSRVISSNISEVFVTHTLNHCNISSFQVIQYQEQSNVAFMLLVKSQNQNEPLDSEELMKFV